MVTNKSKEHFPPLSTNHRYSTQTILFRKSSPRSARLRNAAVARAYPSRKERAWKAMIGASGDGQTFFCVVQHHHDLLPCHTRKPIQKIIYASALLQILEKGLHRHTGPFEKPSAANALWIPLHRNAS